MYVKKNIVTLQTFSRGRGGRQSTTYIDNMDYICISIKGDTAMNELSEEDIAKVWSPEAFEKGREKKEVGETVQQRVPLERMSRKLDGEDTTEVRVPPPLKRMAGKLEQGMKESYESPLQRMSRELKEGRKRLPLKGEKPSRPGGEDATMKALLERRTVGDLSLPCWYVERFKRRG